MSSVWNLSKLFKIGFTERTTRGPNTISVPLWLGRCVEANNLQPFSFSSISSRSCTDPSGAKFRLEHVLYRWPEHVWRNTFCPTLAQILHISHQHDVCCLRANTKASQFHSTVRIAGTSTPGWGRPCFPDWFESPCTCAESLRQFVIARRRINYHFSHLIKQVQWSEGQLGHL